MHRASVASILVDDPSTLHGPAAPSDAESWATALQQGSCASSRRTCDSAAAGERAWEGSIAKFGCLGFRAEAREI